MASRQILKSRASSQPATDTADTLSYDGEAAALAYVAPVVANEVHLVDDSDNEDDATVRRSLAREFSSEALQSKAGHVCLNCFTPKESQNIVS